MVNNGRPKLIGATRHKNVVVYVSPEEHHIIEEKAKTAGLTISTYARLRVLS